MKSLIIFTLSLVLFFSEICCSGQSDQANNSNQEVSKQCVTSESSYAGIDSNWKSSNGDESSNLANNSNQEVSKQCVTFESSYAGTDSNFESGNGGETDPNYNVIIGEDGGHSSTWNLDARFSENRLMDLFHEMKEELSQVNKFYDYFDVLSTLDKSIALVDSLINTILINKDNTKSANDANQEITSRLDIIDKLLPIVEELLQQKEGTPDFLKFDNIRSYVICLKKRIDFQKKQFKDYKYVNLEEYRFADDMRIERLTNLKEKLNDMRELI